MYVFIPTWKSVSIQNLWLSDYPYYHYFRISWSLLFQMFFAFPTGIAIMFRLYLCNCPTALNHLCFIIIFFASVLVSTDFF